MSKKIELTDEQINRLLAPIESDTRNNDLPNLFVATICGTDYKSRFGSYAIGYQIDNDDSLFEIESGHVPQNDSHQTALVAALQRIIERSPLNAKIELRTTSEYISLTISEHIVTWKANGWVTNQFERPEHVEQWKSIDADIEQKNLEVSPRLIDLDLLEKDQVLRFLEMVATNERDRFIKSAC